MSRICFVALQGVVIRSVPINIRKARTAKGYNSGSNTVASKVDCVRSHPEVISGLLLQTESVASPEFAMLAGEFGESHPVLSCLSPMASSPCLPRQSLFGVWHWNWR